MAWGNIFGNVSQDQLQSALTRANPYGAETIGGGPWSAGQPLVQNPQQVQSAIAKSKGGGMLGQVMGGAGALGGGGQQPAPPQGSYAQPRDIGDENQKKAFGKLGSLIGAVGSFYTGNYGGMANSIKGLSG